MVWEPALTGLRLPRQAQCCADAPAGAGDCCSTKSYAVLVTAGGHLNPAVTLGFVLTAKISIPRAFFYIIFQCLGACTGSALVKAVSGLPVSQLNALV